MAAPDVPSPSPRLRSLCRLLHLKRSPPLAADHNPLMSSSPPPPPPPQATSAIGNKKAFVSSALCGLGCAFSDSSSTCSSENKQGKRPKRRRTKKIEKEAREKLSSSISSLAGDESVGSLSHDVERALTERPCSGRSGGSLEQMYSVEDSFPSFQATLLGSDLLPYWHYHRMREYDHHHPVDFEEIMYFQHRVRSLRVDVYDRYSDWRLDVDNLTYEELVELGDKIGYVSTGLREEEIACSIVEVKPSNFYMERKCSVCQEEYEMDDDVGKLSCGHSFHRECIKKWLLQKNACPVCKTDVSKT